MLTLDEGKTAVGFARDVIESHVRKTKLKKRGFSEKFNEKSGAFVTILTYPDHNLRGCIGIPEPVYELKQAIEEAARSATRDPRFPPLSEDELDKVIVEVTILTPPELIRVSNPREYLSEVKIGRDGLIVEKGFYRGLLLPQVPVEYNWEVDDFLAHTCMKAGLPPDAWLDEDTKIYRFSGQIFAEREPYGEVEERKISRGEEN